MQSKVTALAALCCVLSACNERDSRTGASSPDGSNVEWTVDPQPLLELGTTDVDERYAFHQVKSVHRAASGNLIVADGATQQVRVFTASGDFVASFGGRGGSDREFSALSSVSSFGDSLMALDAFALRVSIWGSDGSFGRSIRLDAPLPALHAARAGTLGFGLVVPERVPLPRVEGGRAADSLSLYITDTNGMMSGMLDRLIYYEQVAVRTPSGRVRLTILPLAPESRVAFGADRVYYATGRTPMVYRRDYKDGKLDSIGLGRPLRLFTDEIKERFVASRLSRVEDGRRAELRAHFESFPHEEYLPTLDRLLEDDLGFLWVREFRVLDDPLATWIVIAPDGSIASTLQLDGTLTPMHIGKDFLAGIRLDESDREVVTLLTLRRE